MHVNPAYYVQVDKYLPTSREVHRYVPRWTSDSKTARGRLRQESWKNLQGQPTSPPGGPNFDKSALRGSKFCLTYYLTTFTCYIEGAKYVGRVFLR